MIKSSKPPRAQAHLYIREWLITQAWSVHLETSPLSYGGCRFIHVTVSEPLLSAHRLFGAMRSSQTWCSKRCWSSHKATDINTGFLPSKQFCLMCKCQHRCISWVFNSWNNSLCFLWCFEMRNHFYGSWERRVVWDEPNEVCGKSKLQCFTSVWLTPLAFHRNPTVILSSLVLILMRQKHHKLLTAFYGVLRNFY